MLSHCHCERKSERDSMRFLWLQSARWLGFPGGTDNYNFDIACGSGRRLKCLPQGASDVVTPLCFTKFGPMDFLRLTRYIITSPFYTPHYASCPFVCLFICPARVPNPNPKTGKQAQNTHQNWRKRSQDRRSWHVRIKKLKDKTYRTSETSSKWRTSHVSH